MSTKIPQCPCHMSLAQKEHGRVNPSNKRYIIMCRDHARKHDNGETFELLTETNR